MDYRSRISRHAMIALAGVALAASLQGCRSPAPGSPDSVAVDDADLAAADGAFMREPFEDQARAAVLRQRTLFDHHFESDAPTLTPLGRRDLGILARAMMSAGGRISIDQGHATAELYAERIASVRSELGSLGIPVERVEIGSGPAGGNGVAGADAILIRAALRDERKRTAGRQSMGGDAAMTSSGGAQ